MSRFVPEPVGGALERALANLGVHWSLGRVVQSLDDENGAVRVTLSDGTRFRSVRRAGAMIRFEMGLRLETFIAVFS